MGGDSVTATGAEDALWEAVEHLQAMIRIDSVNPPGNEIGVARYLNDVLRGAGIHSEIAETAPDRAVVCARIRGDGSKRPLLLMAHTDVVGVERDKWTTNPFAGEMLDGFIYGRGAIDDKGMLASNLQAMLVMQRAVARGEMTLSRDVVFLATCDEEAGGRVGIAWILQNRPEWLDAEFALNEGGGLRSVDGKLLYCAVQCAEKVPHNLTVTATGEGGHSSVPHDANAIARLSRALAVIAAHREPVRLSEVTRGFLRALGPMWNDPEVGTAMVDVTADDSDAHARGSAKLAAIPSLDALLRNTTAITTVTGGTRSNVLPTEAVANVNVRMLPGFPVEDLLTRLTRAVNDANVEITVRSSGRPAPASPIASEMFEAIVHVLRELAPEAPCVPALSAGATDSAALRLHGIHCYGVLPFPMPQEDEDRMHGHDERLSVDALSFGITFTCDVVDRLCRAPL